MKTIHYLLTSILLLCFITGCDKNDNILSTSLSDPKLQQTEEEKGEKEEATTGTEEPLFFFEKSRSFLKNKETRVLQKEETDKLYYQGEKSAKAIIYQFTDDKMSSAHVTYSLNNLQLVTEELQNQHISLSNINHNNAKNLYVTADKATLITLKQTDSEITVVYEPLLSSEEMEGQYMTPLLEFGKNKEYFKKNEKRELKEELPETLTFSKKGYLGMVEYVFTKDNKMAIAYVLRIPHTAYENVKNMLNEQYTLQTNLSSTETIFLSKDKTMRITVSHSDILSPFSICYELL